MTAAEPAAGAERSALARRRRALIAYWEELGGAPGVGGLERFGRLVQRMADEAVAATDADDEAKRALLDDMVDVFVPDGFRRLKAVVMRSPAVVRHGFIHDSEEVLASFAPELREGEGRFRHFAMNAAAASVAPDPLVAVAAALVGGDVPGLAAEGSDSAADLAANRLGRDFASLLAARPLASLAGGEGVYRWIVEAFGPPGV